MAKKLRILRLFSCHRSHGVDYTQQEFERECFVELNSAASSFQKSAPENCATELARRKLEIFPGDRSHNVSFFNRSFHRFPVHCDHDSIDYNETRRATFVRRRGCLHRRCHISLHYRALLLRKFIACKEKDAWAWCLSRRMHPYELSNWKPRETVIIDVFNVHFIKQKLRAYEIIGSIGITVTAD